MVCTLHYTNGIICRFCYKLLDLTIRNTANIVVILPSAFSLNQKASKTLWIPYLLISLPRPSPPTVAYSVARLSWKLDRLAPSSDNKLHRYCVDWEWTCKGGMINITWIDYRFCYKLLDLTIRNTANIAVILPSAFSLNQKASKTLWIPYLLISLPRPSPPTVAYSVARLSWKLDRLAPSSDNKLHRYCVD